MSVLAVKIRPMAEEPGTPTATTVAPVMVEYDPVTGVPAEYNEYLPSDSLEYKKWKAAQEGPESMAKLTLKDKQGNEIEKQLPGGKVKKKQKPSIVLERNTRNKKKCVTTLHGLGSFGVKLSDAAKVFGKKFACGASVTKSATGEEQIDVQGDFLDQLAELIVKNYGGSHSIQKSDIYYIHEKRRERYFDEDSDDEA